MDTERGSVELPPAETGEQLEFFVAAHFASRGCFVETNIDYRDPDSVSDVDVVWTDYTHAKPKRRPIEVKGGKWNIGDLLKFYGWTQALKLAPGVFAYRVGTMPPEGRRRATIERLLSRIGVTPLAIETRAPKMDQLTKDFGLPAPEFSDLPTLWRYCWWARRKYFEALQEGHRAGTLVETCRRAKDYRRLVNDVLFFERDPRARYVQLYRAHEEHPKIALSAATELESGYPNFDNPTSVSYFRDALYRGKHFPVQACLLIEMRARLYLIKTAVDYCIARRDDQFSAADVQGFTSGSAFHHAVEYYERFEWFPRLPVLWQAVLGVWGGFLLSDHLAAEHEALARHSGIPVEAMPEALKAFDYFFPMEGAWWVRPSGDDRTLLKLMPAAIRGIGAMHRRKRYGALYNKLRLAPLTRDRLASDEETMCRLFKSSGSQLAG